MKVYLNTTGGSHSRFSEDRVLVGQEIFLDDSAVRSITQGNVVIADGVGGNRGGAVAAFKVCKMISDIASPTKDDFIRINNAIIEQGLADENRRNMATTLTGICFDGSGSAYYYHVGNTRLYSIQAGLYLNQITEDDTVVNHLVKTGKLTEEDAIEYPKRNEITACFGGNSSSLLHMTIGDLDLKKHFCFLLTCDGIHESVSIDEMEDILAEDGGDWDLVVERLVDTAKANGSTDDCTAVIIDCKAEVDTDGIEVS